MCDLDHTAVTEAADKGRRVALAQRNAKGVPLALPVLTSGLVRRGLLPVGHGLSAGLATDVLADSDTRSRGRVRA